METTSIAYMLRRDGVAFPCIQHYYGNLECVEETLYAAEWLYSYTMWDETREAILDLISAYGCSFNPMRNNARNLVGEIKKRPYKFLTQKFVYQIAGQLRRLSPEDLPRLNDRVCRLLNQEFTRVRLGGLYNTVIGCEDLYFRISSDNFEWSLAIREFLQNHCETAKTITIIRDEESTGASDFYKTQAGKDINHLPIEEYIKTV